MSIMVDQIVSNVFNNVTQLLAQEINLIHGARDEVISLQRELRLIREFLRNAEGKRDQMEEVVNQIQSVALQAEEVVDDFVYHMEKHKRRSTLSKVGHVGGHLKMMWDVAKEIKDINQQIDKIFGNKNRYAASEVVAAREVAAATEAAAILNRRRRDVEEKDVVGLVVDASSVIKKLNTPDPRPDVVSIIGTGGLGKTTLAKKIYSSSFVKKEFDCRCWVDVSQEYNPQALLRRLLKSFSKEEVDKLTEEELVEKLQVALKNKRYLIVLDDLWYKHQWDGIKRAFPENERRSRIMITSRDKEVASHAAGRTLPYFLPFLNEDDSWKLFSQKAFRGELCPPKHENLVKEILTKCKGLPLAIVVVAGILANRDESMWSIVATSISSYSKEWESILALSYDILPPHLKPCFLYFGVYPEDFEIPVRQLIRLWVAEGFVDQDNNMHVDMEDVAEEYLSQLIDRSLIQVARRRTNGGVKYCRIHDLLRDLAVSQGKREKFLELHTDINRPFGATESRRMSIHCGSNELRYTNYPNVSRVRSLLCVGENSGRYFPFSNKDPFVVFSNSCRFLKVLDLGSKWRVYYPPKVNKLVHLRYLVMGEMYDQDLTHISKLINLQTLEIRRDPYSKKYFHVNIWEMQRLRHLHLPFTISLSSPKDDDINRILPNLRTLSRLDCNENANREYLMAGKFPNLKKLNVQAGGSGDYGIFECLNKLQCLQTLRIRDKFLFTDTSVLPFSLTKIRLEYTWLHASAFVSLGELPSLQVLKLRLGSLDGYDFECRTSERHFPRLEVLHMSYLGIGYWKMEGQGLKRIRYLSIYNCRKLKAIPNQLKELSTFRQLTVSGCDHPAFTEDLKQIWLNDPRLIIEHDSNGNRFK